MTTATLLVMMIDLAALLTQPDGRSRAVRGPSPDLINSASDNLAIREACLADLDNDRKLKECRPYLGSDGKGSKETPRRGLRLCRDSLLPSQICSCAANGIDVRCIYRICGYEGGYYSDESLLAFSMRVADELTFWGAKAVVSSRYVGFADGKPWGQKKEPKPQPIAADLDSCLRRAAKKSESTLLQLNDIDRRDAELALLRGCALEKALKPSIWNFEFDSLPGFSFEKRRNGVEDSRIRAAELEVVIADACGRLAP
jgi:hypothetical protein